LNSSRTVFPSKTFFESNLLKSSFHDFVTCFIALAKSLGVFANPGPFSGTESGMEINASKSKIF